MGKLSREHAEAPVDPHVRAAALAGVDLNDFCKVCSCITNTYRVDERHAGCSGTAMPLERDDEASRPCGCMCKRAIQHRWQARQRAILLAEEIDAHVCAAVRAGACPDDFCASCYWKTIRVRDGFDVNRQEMDQLHANCSGMTLRGGPTGEAGKPCRCMCERAILHRRTPSAREVGDVYVREALLAGAQEHEVCHECKNHGHTECMGWCRTVVNGAATSRACRCTCPKAKVSGVYQDATNAHVQALVAQNMRERFWSDSMFGPGKPVHLRPWPVSDSPTSLSIPIPGTGMKAFRDTFYGPGGSWSADDVHQRYFGNALPHAELLHENVDVWRLESEIASGMPVDVPHVFPIRDVKYAAWARDLDERIAEYEVPVRSPARDSDVRLLDENCLREDAYWNPEYAEARRAAVLAARERCNRWDYTQHSASMLLGWLHGHEKDSAHLTARQRSVAMSVHAHPLLVVYERVRAMGARR